MEAYLGHIISSVALGAMFIGGYVKLRVEVISRLTRIEERIENEEKYREERNASMMLRMRDVVYKFCRDECQHGHSVTNPRMQAYDGEILP